tara:strand:- start:22410 stop:22643 length:234 start_codon:yes stop_codon:yes gene_type:complete
MTVTKRDLIKQIVSHRMQELMDTIDEYNYMKELERLYTELEQKDIDSIIIQYNTFASEPVTLSEVSTNPISINPDPV